MNFRFLLFLILTVQLMVVNCLGQHNLNLTIDSLNEASYDSAYSNPKLSIELAKRSESLCVSSEYAEGQVRALLRKGRAYCNLGDLDSANLSMNKAYKVFSGNEMDSNYLAQIHLSQGFINKKLGQLDSAAINYHLVYELGEEQKNSSLMRVGLMNMAITFKLSGDYKSAVSCLLRAKQIIDAGDLNLKGRIHCSLGGLYELQGRNSTALDSYDIAKDCFMEYGDSMRLSSAYLKIGDLLIKTGQIDTSRQYLYEALSISEKNLFYGNLSKAYKSIGNLFLREEKLDSALVFFKKSLKVSEDNHDSISKSEIYENIGDAYFQMELMENALLNYQKSYNLSFSQDYPIQQMLSSSKLSHLYASMGSLDKSVEYFQIYNQLRDSLSSNLKEALIQEMNFTKENYKLDKLRTNEKLLELHSSKNRYILLGSVITLFFLILIFVSYRRLQKQKLIRIRYQNEVLKVQQEVDNLINNQEFKTMNALIQGQEVERKRIAREIHDKLGSMLSTVKLYFTAIDNQVDKLKEENLIQYQKASELLDEACQEVRKIAHESSSNKLQLGLFEATRELKRRIEDSGEVRVALSTHGLDAQIKLINELSIYRIIQELISNSLRHGRSSEITIQLNVFQAIFNLIVEDDGLGFDVVRSADNRGMGLNNVETRVKQMDGTITIDSIEGAGTTVSIDIPLNKKSYK